MAAYVVVIRKGTTDPSKLEQYAALAREAPIDRLELVASSKLSGFQTLEGAQPDALVLMRFPAVDDALAWYNSEAYQKALPHRLAAADFNVFLIEGVK